MVGHSYKALMAASTQGPWERCRILSQYPFSSVGVQTINHFAKFLARSEEGNPLRWHFDWGSGFWIARDAPSSLPRVEPSESADLNLAPSSQSTNDAVKYGGHDGVRFLEGHPNGLVNLFGQIGSGHLAHPRRITKKSITVLPGAPDAGSCRMVGQAGPKSAFWEMDSRGVRHMARGAEAAKVAPGTECSTTKRRQAAKWSGEPLPGDCCDRRFFTNRFQLVDDRAVSTRDQAAMPDEKSMSRRSLLVSKSIGKTRLAVNSVEEFIGCDPKPGYSALRTLPTGVLL